MPHLHLSPISLSSLTSLASINVFSILDFIQADVEKITLNSDLDGETVLRLKHEFITDYSSKPLNGFEYFSKFQKNFIRTHIIGLDNFLEGGVMKGSIVEFCGSVNSGKTQISLSVAVNAASSGIKVEFIDTKRDFSASRCNQLLPSNLSDEVMDQILENIHVYNPRDIYSLISTIDSFKSKFQSSESYERLIIIDCMTVPYLPLVGLQSNKGLSLLSYIATSLKELAEVERLPVLVTNLGVQHFELEEEELAKRELSDLKPLLGKYWLHVPNTRVFVTQEHTSSTKRLLSLQKSDYLQLSKTGEIIITETGVT